MAKYITFKTINNDDVLINEDYIIALRKHCPSEYGYYRATYTIITNETYMWNGLIRNKDYTITEETYNSICKQLNIQNIEK